jgi:hypothetical protein
MPLEVATSNVKLGGTEQAQRLSAGTRMWYSVPPGHPEVLDVKSNVEPAGTVHAHDPSASAVA